MMGSAASHGQAFNYGFGRVGVLQELLLSQSDIDRLLATRTAQELTQAIAELRISSHVDYTANPYRYVNAIELWMQREVRQMVPESLKSVFDILWLKDDVSLLAYLLKKHHGLTSQLSIEPHVGATAFDADDLKALVRGERPGSLPESLLRFVRRMLNERQTTPQAIDLAVAQYVALRQVELAKLSGSRAIALYVAHHIDLQNLRTATRLSPEERPADHLLEGGEIPVRRFSLEPERLAELIFSSTLPATLAEDVRLSRESWVTLERGLAKAIAHDLAIMRGNPLTIDPLFAFAAMAMSQMRLLRTVLVGKGADMAADDMRKLLPPLLSTAPFA